MKQQYAHHEVLCETAIFLKSTSRFFFIKYGLVLFVFWVLWCVKSPASVIIGNPRKLLWRPFLTVNKIYLIDDGLGSVVKGGYFDPEEAGSNRVKGFLIKSLGLPRYRNSVERASGHFTFFDQYTKLFPGVEQLPMKFECSVNEEIMGIASQPEISLAVLTNLNGIAKLSNVERNLEKMAGDVPRFVSFHPTEERGVKEYIINHFELNELCLRGLSTEEFVAMRAQLGLKTNIFGMLNTSSALIKSIRNFRGKICVDFIDHQTGEIIDSNVYKRS